MVHRTTVAPSESSVTPAPENADIVERPRKHVNDSAVRSITDGAEDLEYLDGMFNDRERE